MKRNANCTADDAMTTFCSRRGTALLFTAMLLLGACASPARADESPRTGTPDADAGRLVEKVLRKAGGNDPDSLGEWTRSIIDRALERAGETARQTVPGQAGPSVPLPAERHAAGIAGDGAAREGSAEVLIFTSLSVPAASWRQWAHDAARTGVPLVLRGVAGDGLAETAKRIGDRLGGTEAGVAIDPRLFRLFGIERVPAVVVVPGGVPPCESRGCSDPGTGSGAGFSAPPHDLIAGNIGLVAALEAIAAEGEAGREIAKAYLDRLTGDGQ
ncbi:MAG: type-F conjugative transfer system pilin assembly protein TrbC [Rhodospirillales bacterium]|nr:type-F conjugative transfer system pilin assembly protein TrbC [Rhodospirillales bacterium]MDE0381537.1 type-F conjugative transfer system pilin assembly protein TrbC [Rhodospirillales bacterium]